MNKFQFQAQHEPLPYPNIYDDESNANILTCPGQQKHSHGSSTDELSSYSDQSQQSEQPKPPDADEYIYNLNLRYYPTYCQEQFIHEFLPHETISKLKLSMCYEIVDDEETQKFEEWVQSLHTQNGAQLARELKVKKYLEKKRSRTYEKKVHYLVRQKVAGERMRIKGRFITWRQAVKLIDNDDSKKEWTYNDYFRIKALLYQKFNISS